MNQIRTGDIFLVDFKADTSSNIIRGFRPAIVVKTSNNSPLIHLVPLSTSVRKKLNCFHIKITGYGLDKPSIALIEQICPMDKSKLGKKIGSISKKSELQHILHSVKHFFELDAA